MNGRSIPVQRERIEERVCKALLRLFEKDSYLLKVDANERSITHRLGLYLQEVFPGWDVDCEYNRDGHETKHLTNLYADVESDQDTEERDVLPDIIVHKRGTECNLLVVEVKKNTSSESADKRDSYKLCAFMKELGYKHALFLKLGVGDDCEFLDDFIWLQTPQ